MKGESSTRARCRRTTKQGKVKTKKKQKKETKFSGKTWSAASQTDSREQIGVAHEIIVYFVYAPRHNGTQWASPPFISEHIH